MQREGTEDVLVIRQRERCLADVFCLTLLFVLPGFGLRRSPVRSGLKGFYQ